MKGLADSGLVESEIADMLTVGRSCARVCPAGCYDSFVTDQAPLRELL